MLLIWRHLCCLALLRSLMDSIRRRRGRETGSFVVPLRRGARQPTDEMQKYRNNKHHGNTRNGKQETRRDDRPDGSRIRDPDEVYVEQLSLATILRLLLTSVGLIWKRRQARPINDCVDRYTNCRRGRKRDLPGMQKRPDSSQRTGGDLSKSKRSE